MFNVSDVNCCHIHSQLYFKQMFCVKLNKFFCQEFFFLFPVSIPVSNQLKLPPTNSAVDLQLLQKAWVGGGGSKSKVNIFFALFEILY